MPPRARKTTTPSQSLKAANAPETAAPEEVAPPVAETAPAVPKEESAPTPAPEEPAPAKLEVGPEAEPSSPAGKAVAALLEPPSMTYRWVSANGDGSGPCRLCNPAGPPPGAGSIGCSHGQWVRVQDGDG